MQPHSAKIILKAKSWSSYLISRGSKNYSLNARNINLISQNSYFRQNPTFIAASNFSRRQRKNENGNVSNWRRFEIIIWSNGFHIYISLLWEMIYDIYLIDFQRSKDNCCFQSTCYLHAVYVSGDYFIISYAHCNKIFKLFELRLFLLSDQMAIRNGNSLHKAQFSACCWQIQFLNYPRVQNFVSSLQYSLLEVYIDIMYLTPFVWYSILRGLDCFGHFQTILIS